MLLLPDVHTHTQYGNALALHNFRIGKDSVLPSGYFSAGIHPWDAGTENHAQAILTLQGVLENPNCIGIGETGLDTLQGDNTIQKQLLKIHLDHARQTGKPCILHLVRDTQTWHQIRRPYGHTIQCIIHGFRGKAETAMQHIQNGDYLSFGAALLKDTRLQNVLSMLPPERYFLETDTADPALLHELYTLTAKLRNMHFMELQNEILCTFRRQFKIEWN